MVQRKILEQTDGKLQLKHGRWAVRTYCEDFVEALSAVVRLSCDVVRGDCDEGFDGFVVS